MAPQSSVVQITTNTHFPIKLTASNFPVWRKQVLSTLIGLDLDSFITRTTKPPSKLLAESKPNPDYTIWHRQDQIIISALLGSCSDAIQPLLSSAETAREAWNRLNVSYANTYRSRIISLKSKLTKNPKGTRPVADFLNEMRTIADELALAQSPVSDEDLMVHILAQLGDDYTPISAAIKVRETPLSYSELFDKLVDFERALQERDPPTTEVLTANFTQRQHPRNSNRFYGANSNYSNRNHRIPNNKNNRSTWQPSNSEGDRSSRASTFCKYCNIPGHDTRDCRKLARFLKENHVTISPVVNNTTPRSNPTSQSWMFDTGASDHITTDRSSLHHYPTMVDLMKFHLAMETLNFAPPHDPYSCLMFCVFPNLNTNLFPLLNYTNRVSVEFFPYHFLVKDLRTGAPLLRGRTSMMSTTTPLGHFDNSIPQQKSPSLICITNWDIHPFHFGINPKTIRNVHCDSCLVNKSHKLPFGQNSFVAHKPLQLIYSDVWGPIQKSIDGFGYYVIFVDFYSKYIWLYPMKRKSDVSHLFPQFKMLVEKYFQTPLISLFTDNGGEYQGLASYLKSVGISHFTTPPPTRRNKMASPNDVIVMWLKPALLYFTFPTAVHLINRLPTTILDSKSPFEVIHGQPPNYSTLKSFRCLCYPWLKPYSTSKLQPKSTPCTFLGYSLSKSAYKCYDPKSRRLFHSRHVQFVEHVFPYKSTTLPFTLLPTPTTFLADKPILSPPSNPPSNQIPHLTQPPTLTATQNTQPTSQPDTIHLNLLRTKPSHLPHPTTRKIMSLLPIATYLLHIYNTNLDHTSQSPTPSTQSLNSPPEPSPCPPPRTRKPNQRYFNPSFVNTSTLHPIPSIFEPTTHNQALKDPKWREAMDSEFNALLQNHTWELVPKTSQTPSGNKWVFRVKRNPDGSVAKYKARLVAKGFLQQYGRDYFETFSPVTKPVTIRTILSIALSKGWPLRQVDVNNAFLQGTLCEEVYMVQPPGYTHPQYPNHICKLRKSLYGLKQAPRAWYIELTTFLLQSGFKKSLADASLFIYSCGDIMCYFMVYVDDIVITGNNNSFLDRFVDTLARRFSVKDLGSLHYFLGIEVIPTNTGLFLTQHRHIHDMLAQFNMAGAKEVVTPLSSTDVLHSNDGTQSVDPTPYRKIVGSLQYLAFTRPDISFAVNRLSQFMHAPSQKHWQALKRVLRYLKGTIHFGLFLKRNSPLHLTAFSDSDWGGISDGGRSTTAYLLYLGSNIISWRSNRQKSVSRSSTEAEYKALANAAAEVLWVKHLLQELGVPISTTPTLYCDNTGATYLCANPVYHSRMKHVALDYHFVREQVTNASLKVLHINSKDQLVDVLTKPLSRQPFLLFRSKIGVSNGASILRGVSRLIMDSPLDKEFYSIILNQL
ncbi:LOW QUALITY PROTEIN: hypothetical protein OSB04_007545 [Centaurea solstitialis]|uniref:Integrase catalytic domain-containing protein n=1 Tax=Centaurea solstitialis TaxID=347529 RepID=A0AA38WQX6_9ASTR|nr:LOW QUALITY PROTEIN: hypothetical protein OSB04_007545 [Centaurea solstitialis]